MMQVGASLAKKFAATHGEKLKQRIEKENSYGKALYENKPPESNFKSIHSYDPTKKKGSYKPWLTHTYLNGGIRYAEDLPRAYNALKSFHENKHKLSGSQRDIQNYKTLPQLESVVEQFDKDPKEDISSKSWSDKGKQLIKNGEAKELHNDKDYWIVQPKTTKASQHFGVNTKWCTAARDENENMFPEYNRYGRLTYTLHKPTNIRFAVFEPDSSIKDDVNRVNPYTRQGPQAFDERDEELKGKDITKNHPIAANVIHSHFMDPHHSYFFGKRSDIPIDKGYYKRYFVDKPLLRKYVKSTKDKSHIPKMLHYIHQKLEDEPNEGFNGYHQILQILAPHVHSKHLEPLVNSKLSDIREIPARHSNNRKQLEKLANDDHSTVKTFATGKLNYLDSVRDANGIKKKNI